MWLQSPQSHILLQMLPKIYKHLIILIYWDLSIILLPKFCRKIKESIKRFTKIPYFFVTLFLDWHFLIIIKYYIKLFNKYMKNCCICCFLGSFVEFLGKYWLAYWDLLRINLLQFYILTLEACNTVLFFCVIVWVTRWK